MLEAGRLEDVLDPPATNGIEEQRTMPDREGDLRAGVVAEPGIDLETLCFQYELHVKPPQCHFETSTESNPQPPGAPRAERRYGLTGETKPSGFTATMEVSSRLTTSSASSRMRKAAPPLGGAVPITARSALRDARATISFSSGD